MTGVLPRLLVALAVVLLTSVIGFMAGRRRRGWGKTIKNLGPAPMPIWLFGSGCAVVAVFLIMLATRADAAPVAIKLIGFGGAACFLFLAFVGFAVFGYGP